MILIIGYVYMMVHIHDGWENTPEWVIPQGDAELTCTVIIPARNEEAHIKACVQSVKNSIVTHKPGGQLMVIDDHSTDGTADIATRSGASVVSLNQQGGKKTALNHGVEESAHDLIICTDADCVVKKEWVPLMVSMYEINRPDFVTGPLLSRYKEDRLSAFQSLDALMMIATTANGIYRQSYFLANGANMSFTSSAYHQVGGMSSHSKYASGDDVFLAQSIAMQDPHKVKYCKHRSASVTTEPLSSWNSLWSQRKRWATKTKHYPAYSPVKIQAYVFIIHLVILVGFLIAPWTGGLSVFSSVFMLFIKWIMDYLLLAKVAKYFQATDPLKYFFSCSVIYFFYIFLMAFWALTGVQYTWKGRKTS